MEDLPRARARTHIHNCGLTTPEIEWHVISMCSEVGQSASSSG